MKTPDNTGFVLWFTGFSGSGKSTLSETVTTNLRERCRLETLDGDVFRSAFSVPIGFSETERRRNIETAGLVAKILSENGISVISSFITPINKIEHFFARTSLDTLKFT